MSEPRDWLEAVDRAAGEGDARLTSPTVRAAAVVLAGAADAHGYRYPRALPCSRCGTPSPAALLDECDDASCPLEGARGEP